LTTNSAYGTYSVAPESIAAVYGSNLAATTTQAAPGTAPAMLGGVTVTVKDANGAVFPTGVLYVSSNQVNCLIPRGAASGAGTITVSNGSATFTGTVSIAATAPGLYTANGAGQGPAAAQTVSGANYTATFQCSMGACVPIPINLSGASLLVLYGTGIRGAAQANVSVRIGNIDAPVEYAGPQGIDPGLDQVNVLLSAALKGRGQLVVTVTVNGQATNMGELAFQ
jgi:uncharacterized protein (TIGR03437 family)